MDPKDEIKVKLDIVALVGEYLELKPAGMHGFRALCPFHGEKSPSFHVSSDRQIFHCFGCGEGGDIFTFVQKMEGLDFHEALVLLGKKAGVEIKRFATAEGNLKQRLMTIHEMATSFYKKVLTDASIAQVPRDYLTNRGINTELIERFELGFAPDDWSKLSDALLKRGFSESELVQAGLSLKKKSGSGVIDRFRNRIMVPLRDQHGNTVGFTGRVLPGSDDKSAKYMNSPETPIYHKGRLVYGLDLAKRAIKEQKGVIVVEGNLDVVASHKAHVENVVGSSGTAFTQDQLELLKRYTDTVIFCFDRDAAGLIAAKKGVSLARGLGFDVRALILPKDVKDPDDLVQKNPEAWKKIASESVPFMQFLLDQTLVNRDVTNVDDKRFISQQILPAIVEITDVVEREHWLQKIASLLAVDPTILRQAINSAPAKGNKKESVPVKPTVKPVKLSKVEQVALALIGLSINLESHRAQILRDLSEIEMPSRDTDVLYTFVASAYNHPVNIVQKSFFDQLRSVLDGDKTRESLRDFLDQSVIFAEQTTENMSDTEISQELVALFAIIRAGSRLDQRKMLAQRLRLAESSGDHVSVSQLMEQLKDLT